MAYDIKLDARVMMGIPTLSKNPRTPGWIDGMSGLQMPLGSSLARKWIIDQEIAEARNNLCTAAVNSDCEYLFFLGDDVIPPPNAILTMLEKIGREFPVRTGAYKRASMITGVYWTKAYPPEPYIFRVSEKNRLLDGSYKKWMAGEFFDVDVAGCDCLLVEVSMLKEMGYPWFSTDWIWEPGQSISAIATEDYYFYTKARDLGYHLFADTSIQCMHEDRTSRSWFGLTMEMTQAGGFPVVGSEEVYVADLGAGFATPPQYFGDKAKIIRFDAREDTHPDVRCDIQHIDPHWFEKFDWVVASHVLEHFRRADAYNVLKHWIKLLKPGGKLSLHVPNIEHAWKIIDAPLGSVADEEKAYAWSQLYGDQEKSGLAWQHLNGFTPRKLESLLQHISELGEIVVEEEMDGLNLHATATLVGDTKPYALSTVWKRIVERENGNHSNSGADNEIPALNEGAKGEEVKEVVNPI